MSPLRVEEYHTDDLAAKLTEPMITELGAIKLALEVEGYRSPYFILLRDGTSLS